MDAFEFFVYQRGKFTCDAEMAKAVRAVYRSMCLGPRVLRTETAPLAALDILKSRWGDMGPR